MLHLKKSVYCNLNDIRSLWLLQRRKAAMKTPSQDAINLQIFVSLTWAHGQFACEQFGSNAFMNFLTLHWYCRSKTDSLFLVYEFLSPFNFWKHEPSESLVNTKPTLELEFFFYVENNWSIMRHLRGVTKTAEGKLRNTLKLLIGTNKSKLVQKIQTLNFSTDNLQVVFLCR